MPKSYQKAGFTLIELLVVVAIIGLLLSIISISFSKARQKTRDTKRVSDMKQFKTGLDLYFQNGSGYPDTATWNAAVGSQLSCNSIVIMTVPRDPLSPTYNYTYTASGDSFSGCGTTVRTQHRLDFYNEKNAAWYYMNEDGNVFTSGGAPVGFDSLL